jgi:hypothetical protein
MQKSPHCFSRKAHEPSDDDKEELDGDGARGTRAGDASEVLDPERGEKEVPWTKAAPLRRRAVVQVLTCIVVVFFSRAVGEVVLLEVWFLSRFIRERGRWMCLWIESYCLLLLFACKLPDGITPEMQERPEGGIDTSQGGSGAAT